MKYLRTFTDSFAKTAGEEMAIGLVWIWRGTYLAAGFLIVMKIWQVYNG